MLKISIKSRHFNCQLVLSKKLTVIQGASGTGKTRMCEALADVSGAYSVVISDSDYAAVLVPGKNWYEYIDDNITFKRKRIFFIDDASFVMTKEFSELYSREHYSFFVVINRYCELGSFNRLPFDINDIYSLQCNGIDHYLLPILCNVAELNSKQTFDVITEDSNSGYQFFSSIYSQTIQGKGKDQLVNSLTDCKANILLLADQAALGSKLDILLATAIKNSQTLYLPENYLSFEYMLANSNMFATMINIPSHKDICMYLSYERLFTAILENITSGKPYKYDKSKLNSCYFQDCCNKSQRQLRCSIGLAGNKPDALFAKTSWESLIQLLHQKDNVVVPCRIISGHHSEILTNLFIK